MKALAFGIAFAGVVIGYGISAINRELTASENISGCGMLIILWLGIILS